MRRAAIVFAVFLGGALTAGVFFLTSRPVQGAPSAPSQHRSAQEPIYTRVQTVTLHAPATAAIYTTTFTTTFQIYMRDYELGYFIRMPTDAITRAAWCIKENNEPCVLYWGQIGGSPVVTYGIVGDGVGTVYLEYDTRQRAARAPGSRTITITYPIGPASDDERISLTHTLVFSRSIHPALELVSATPEGYTHDDGEQALRWEFASTPRLTFTAAFTEPLLGADLVIERFEIGQLTPDPGDLVRYTVTVRNVGPYETGRAILAELFVRPLAYGPPIVLTDHIGGWAWEDSGQGTVGYYEDALFKWYSGSETTSVWWAGLRPGEVVTGTTVLTWPWGCAEQPCGAWAKVDPTYLDLGVAYEWWGYNPEGLKCDKTEGLVPTCREEADNIASAFKSVYLPLVLRNSR